MAGDESEARVFRRAGISYLRIPAQDPQASAAFYRDVFGWTVDATREEPSFADGSGHVIGHFVPHADPRLATRITRLSTGRALVSSAR